MTPTHRLMPFTLIIGLSLSIAGCLPNTGFRDDGTLHYGLGAETGTPDETYFPSTGNDNMADDDDDDLPSGVGINIGNGSGNSQSNDDVTPLEFVLESIGYERPISVTVQANKILKVRFAPNPQSRAVPGTGFYPAYGALGVYIEVGTLSQPTPLLKVSPRQYSRVMNFSGQFPNSCGSDTFCRTDVKIKVTKPNYDFYCINYPGGWWTGSYWFYPCNYPGHTRVNEKHPWTGTLYVYTDDTGAPQED